MQVEAAGPLWVAPAAGSGAGDDAEDGALVAVLTQCVRVELTVTLHELERPHSAEAADMRPQARLPVSCPSQPCPHSRALKGHPQRGGALLLCV